MAQRWWLTLQVIPAKLFDRSTSMPLCVLDRPCDHPYNRESMPGRPDEVGGTDGGRQGGQRAGRAAMCPKLIQASYGVQDG